MKIVVRYLYAGYLKISLKSLRALFCYENNFSSQLLFLVSQPQRFTTKFIFQAIMASCNHSYFFYLLLEIVIKGINVYAVFTHLNSSANVEEQMPQLNYIELNSISVRCKDQAEKPEGNFTPDLINCLFLFDANCGRMC